MLRSLCSCCKCPSDSFLIASTSNQNVILIKLSLSQQTQHPVDRTEHIKIMWLREHDNQRKKCFEEFSFYTVVYIEQTGKKPQLCSALALTARTRDPTGSLLQINSSIFSSEKILSGILQPACRRAEGLTGISTDCFFFSWAGQGRMWGCSNNSDYWDGSIPEMSCKHSVISFMIWNPQAKSPLLLSDCRTHWDSPVKLPGFPG